MNQQSNNNGKSQQEIIDESIAANNGSSSTMPKTGPEDAILPVLGLAFVATLLTYNIVMFKKNA